MAEITVRGFTSKLETKKSSTGKTYHRYSLSEGQKQQDGTWKKFWYNVTDFSENPPPDSSKVSIKGYLKFKEAANGKVYNDLIANEVELLEGPKSGEAKKPAGKPEKDPWE